jgi:hypothetical protein
MAAYLALKEKSTGKVFSGQGLITIDERICAQLSIIPDPEKWVLNWVNTIGLCLASGQSWAEIRTTYSSALKDPDNAKALNYLETNYTNHSYWGR